jgi:hypothetical protein
MIIHLPLAIVKGVGYMTNDALKQTLEYYGAP